jgi:Fanconi anemia group J protein
VASSAWQDELARVVTDTVRRTPHGVLVFVASFSMLHRLVRRWQLTGAYGALQQCKPLFVEPGGSESEQAHTDAPRNEQFAALLARYQAAAHEVRGACLFGVFRGKAAEGLDFSDENARAVVLVGVPYPSVQDLRWCVRVTSGAIDAYSRAQDNVEERVQRQIGTKVDERSSVVLIAR